MSENKSTNKPADVKLVSGLDVGNGYTKGLVVDAATGQQYDVDLPTHVKKQLSNAKHITHKPSDAPVVLEGDFLNAMVATLGDTALVEDAYRRGQFFYGSNGLRANGDPIVMSIEGLDERGKVAQPLYWIMAFGPLAGTALQAYVAKNGALPQQELIVDVYAAMALPIAEYTSQARLFAESLTGKADSPRSHVVQIRNFDEPVQVRLRFKGVEVLPEGAAAQSAISGMPEAIIQRMMDDSRSLGFSVEGLEPSDVLSAPNVLGTDIGEGTVNLPRFYEDASGSILFDDKNSTTLIEGYGTVLENVVEGLEGSKYPMGSRKALSDFLLRCDAALAAGKPINKFDKPRYDYIVELMNEARVTFVDAIVAAVGKIATEGEVHVLYVYGGGTSNSLVRELLAEKLAGLKVLEGTAVLFTDPKYSRNFNRLGLLLAAKDVYGKKIPAPAAKA